MNQANRRAGQTTRTLTELALLTAVVLVMASTPLGYLRVGPLTMSRWPSALCWPARRAARGWASSLA